MLSISYCSSSCRDACSKEVSSHASVDSGFMDSRSIHSGNIVPLVNIVPPVNSSVDYTIIDPVDVEKYFHETSRQVEAE